MNKLKYTLPYLLWIPLSFVLAFAYMHVLLTNGFTVKQGTEWEGVIYQMVLAHIVPITGSIILFIFIILDTLYLRKVLKQHKSSFLMRLLCLISIALINGIVHYLLEKVIDII